MAKNKNTLGKLLAFTTTVAAIGGTCYIFRDKIKESSLYKTAADKFSDLFSNTSKKNDAFEDDDFFFDDDDDDFENVFSEDSKQKREYTSLTINAKNTTSENHTNEDTSTESADKDTEDDDHALANDSLKQKEADTSSHSAKEVKKETASEKNAITSDSDEKNVTEESIPTIFFDDSSENNHTSASDKSDSYENEGLSDVSEDPDVLEDQDKLDF